MVSIFFIDFYFGFFLTALCCSSRPLAGKNAADGESRLGDNQTPDHVDHLWRHSDNGDGRRMNYSAKHSLCWDFRLGSL
jgi:hypothetical protein